MENYAKLKMTLIGVSPLIMNNGASVDPFNRYTKAKKELTGKTGKTEADLEELSRLDFYGALYMDAVDGPVIPAIMLQANLTAGAKKSKKGKQAEAGCIVEAHARLEYDGPRTPEEMFEDERFRLSVPVKIKGQKVIKTRAIFQSWQAVMEVSYLSSVINERDVLTALRAGGALCGLGDWRPRHGRYALAIDMPTAMAAE